MATAGTPGASDLLSDLQVQGLHFLSSPEALKGTYTNQSPQR